MMLRALSAAEQRILDSIVERLLPDYPLLSQSHAVVARREVAEFVRFQIAHLPAHFLAPYRAALVAFESLALLRYRSRFTRLPPSLQQQYLSFWSTAPFAACRNFVKLIRSCALLAYFDHPLVSEQLRAAGELPRKSEAAR